LVRKRKKKKKRCQPYLKKIVPVQNILYLSALGLCGGPDVPHVALECRTDLAEGNDVGVLKAPPVSVMNFLNDHNNSARGKLNSLECTSNLVFKIAPVAGLEVSWETTLLDETLYVELPTGILPEGSKESLVMLLEYAEEKLKCKHVVVCLSKSRTDRVSLLRVFNFFGFQMLPPAHPLIVSPSPDRLFMAYTIETDSEDEEDSDEDDEVKGTAAHRVRSSSEGSTSSDSSG